MTPTNPEKDQDRAFDLYDTFDKYGYVMFRQQREIYRRIAEEVQGEVLEAGCGNGVGTAIIDHRLVLDDAGYITGTDKLQRNVDFAKCLYPWIDFQVWDISQRYTHDTRMFDTVICIECLEHVADPVNALRNLFAAARKEVWISTPNGRGKPRPPSNPYHCCEWTTDEMCKMIRESFGGGPHAAGKITVMGWEDFKEVEDDTDVDPLVYRIQLSATVVVA